MGIVLGNCSAQVPKASESTSRFDVEASSGAKNESSLGEKDGEGRGYWGMKQNHGAGGVFFGEFANLLCVCVCPAFLGDLPWIGVDCLSSSESSLCIPLLLLCCPLRDSESESPVFRYCPRAEVFV